MLKLDILYFEGCPNHLPTVRLVHEVLHDLAVTADVLEVEVKSHEDAVRLRFFGSPTVRVEGEDIEVTSRSRGDFSFSCRLYSRPGPSLRELLERALRARMPT